MGKILIIKGADFSANAVDHELVEPKEYTNVAGFGANRVFDNVNDGDIYYRCQVGLSDQYPNLNGTIAGFRIKSGTSSVPANLPDNTMVKMDGLYFTTKGNVIRPYYGLQDLSSGRWNSGYGYKITESNITRIDDSSISNTEVPVAAGKTYKIYANGTATNFITLALLKKKDATYVVLGDGPSYNYISYTAGDDDECLIVSHLNLSNFTPWVAEVME